MTTRTRRTHRQITLARLLSKFGITSRSEAAVWIRGGRVEVNGRLVRRPEVWVDPRADSITVDGKPVRPQRLVYAVLHKPRGVVTTRSDERGRQTVYAFLPADLHYLFPVGRLDRESTGLLLLTNDVRFGDRITSPVSHVPKTYLVGLDPPPDAELIREWEKGMMLPDGTQLLPARVSVASATAGDLRVTLIEGKNRQIRRMAKAWGREVTKLHRVSIGDLSLLDLPVGGFRLLTDREVKSLLSEQTKERNHDPRCQPHR